jgi:type II secretory pathway pseudopilin PulG
MTFLKMVKRSNSRGLTLIEMAIILVILGILAGMTLPLLSEVTRQRHYRTTQKEIEEIKDALIGYAGINWRLPFADNNGDGIGDSGFYTGTLPYMDLGLKAQDAWRNLYIYDVNSSLTSTTDKTSFCNALSALSGFPQIQQGAITTSQAAVVISKGENGQLDGENGDGDRIYIIQTPTEAFDDLIISISPILLYGRLNCP